MSTFEAWGAKLRDSFNAAFVSIIELTPKVVGMVLVLVLGYVVARLVNRVIATLAQSLGLDRAAERSGLAASMRHVGIERSMPAVLGIVGFWITLCVFISAAFSILEVPAVTTAMASLAAYIPKVLVATVVVVVGLLLAGFLRGVIATSADRVGLDYAGTLANACYYVLAVMTFLAAFDHLGMKIDMLKELILIAFAALAVGFGLAFGLGGRDVMAGILAGYYTRQRLHPGDRVQVAGHEGTVREVGPVATIIETEENGLLNRHSVPNIRMLNEAVR